jgi:hypothetical protein
MCKNIILTDGDDDILQVLSQNVKLNEFGIDSIIFDNIITLYYKDNVEVCNLKWGDEKSIENLLKDRTIDVIIGSELM